MIWLWFMAACAGPLIFDFLRHTYTVAVPRYAAAALPAACLLLAIALDCIPPLARVIACTIILLGWSINLQSIYRAGSRNNSPIREVARQVSEQCADGDLVIVQSIPSGIVGFARYAKDSVLIASWVEQLKIHTIPGALRTLIEGRSKVYYVKFHLVGAPTPAEDWLRANAKVTQERRVASIVFIEFQLRSP